jgi:hypothetical protein
LDEREDSKIFHTMDTMEEWWNIYFNALVSAAMEKGLCSTVDGGEKKKEFELLSSRTAIRGISEPRETLAGTRTYPPVTGALSNEH